MLVLDDTPTKYKAIMEILTSRAAGQDSIPAEVLQCAGGPGVNPTGNERLHHHNPVKNKGGCSNSNNYRGISPLYIAGKLFSRVMALHCNTLQHLFCFP